MTKKQGATGLVAICAVMLVLAAAGLASDFLTRLISNIDGLLLLMICLLMGVLFVFVLFSIAKDQGWLPDRAAKPSATAAPAAAKANPAPGTAAPAEKGSTRLA